MFLLSFHPKDRRSAFVPDNIRIWRPHWRHPVAPSRTRNSQGIVSSWAPIPGGVAGFFELCTASPRAVLDFLARVGSVEQRPSPSLLALYNSSIYTHVHLTDCSAHTFGPNFQLSREARRRIPIAVGSWCLSVSRALWFFRPSDTLGPSRRKSRASSSSTLHTSQSP